MSIQTVIKVIQKRMIGNPNNLHAKRKEDTRKIYTKHSPLQVWIYYLTVQHILNLQNLQREKEIKKVLHDEKTIWNAKSLASGFMQVQSFLEILWQAFLGFSSLFFLSVSYSSGIFQGSTLCKGPHVMVQRIAVFCIWSSGTRGSDVPWSGTRRFCQKHFCAIRLVCLALVPSAASAEHPHVLLQLCQDASLTFQPFWGAPGWAWEDAVVLTPVLKWVTCSFPSKEHTKVCVSLRYFSLEAVWQSMEHLI